MLHSAFAFTSNVDGQFQKAGFPTGQVAECHGTIHSLQCIKPCVNAAWSAQEFEPTVDESTGRLINDMPTCPRCGKLARPNILMFGDWAWVDKYSNGNWTVLLAGSAAHSASWGWSWVQAKRCLQSDDSASFTVLA